MNGYPQAKDENKINSQYQKLLAGMQDSASAAGKDVKDNSKGVHSSAGTTGKSGVMHSDLMNFTQLLESMHVILEFIEEQNNDTMNEIVPTTAAGSDESPDDDLIKELDKLFTPVLIMQGFEKEAAPQIQEAMSEASVLNERTIIQFDDDAKLSQLRSVCALLIARKKNSEKYQMYAKAHNIKKQMKLDIQKEEYDAAGRLMTAYLDHVANKNESPVARNAANDLLPATQH